MSIDFICCLFFLFFFDLHLYKSKMAVLVVNRLSNDLSAMVIAPSGDYNPRVSLYRLIKTFDKSISCMYLFRALRFCSESYWPLFR